MSTVEKITRGVAVPPPPPREAPARVNGNGSPLPWLNQLGRLSAGFDGRKLLPLLDHSSDKVRQLAVFNLGKLGDANFLPPLQSLAFGDPNTMLLGLPKRGRCWHRAENVGLSPAHPDLCGRDLKVDAGRKFA